jgi:hypothetical protein
VTAAKTDSDVRELVLASFQKELTRLRPGLLRRLVFRLSPMPEIGYAQQYSTTDQRGHMSGPVLGVWRITPDAVEQLPIDFRIPDPDFSGSRYACTYFTFTLPDASGLGVAASQSGPRCGFGYRYRVGIDSVEMEEGLWIS